MCVVLDRSESCCVGRIVWSVVAGFDRLSFSYVVVDSIARVRFVWLSAIARHSICVDYATSRSDRIGIWYVGRPAVAVFAVFKKLIDHRIALIAKLNSNPTRLRTLVITNSQSYSRNVRTIDLFASSNRKQVLIDAMRTLVARVDTRESLAQTADFIERLVGDIWLPGTVERVGGGGGVV
jgi:hypothetical protein